MQIKEITIAHEGGLELSRVPRDDEVDFGFNHEINGYPMKKNRFGVNSFVYYLLDNDKVIAGTLCTPTKIHSTTYFQTNGVQVAPRYRGQELGIRMYHSISHNEHVNLMSGHRQTLDGKKLWSTLSKAFNLAVMDTSTGEIVSRDAKDAYQNYYSDEDDTLVLVTTTTFTENKLLIPSLKIKQRINPIVERFYSNRE